MEHSYVGNVFVKAFESLIKDKPASVVWAGDYAEPEKEGSPYFIPSLNEVKKLENSNAEDHNLYDLCGAKENYKEFKYAGLSFKKMKPKVPEFNCQYIVNNTKQQFVDITKSPKDSDGYQIHPLPLLTCEGNGQGGGDYYRRNKHIGIWALDEIYVSNKKPIGYKELKPNFKI